MRQFLLPRPLCKSYTPTQTTLTRVQLDEPFVGMPLGEFQIRETSQNHLR